jgi:hypothetical protein
MANISLQKDSVSPMTSFAYDYNKIEVNWQLPNFSTFKIFRLVRNQYSYSETPEDGEVLFEHIPNQTTNELITTFIDGETSSLSSVLLVSGQYVYYTVWLLVADSWVKAGQTHVLLPKDHGVYVNKTVKIKSSHVKILDLLPRMYVSSSNSPYDAIDETSTLSRFLKAFSFSYDEILTYADLSTKYTSAKKLATELTISRLADMGIRVTSTEPSSYLKNMVSKAPYLLSIKGTKQGLQSFIETFTGFNAEVNMSNNLLLRSEDSAFHLGRQGKWFSVSQYATLSVDPSSDIPSEDNSLKSPYRLKVVTTTGGLSIIKLGNASQVTTVYEAVNDTIPVKPNTQYTFGFYAKEDAASAAASLAIVPKLDWRDEYGSQIRVDTLTSRNPGTSAWEKFSNTVTSPGKVVTASSYTVGSTGTTITLPTGHGFVTSDVIWVEDTQVPFNGGFTVVSYTTTSVTINYTQVLTFTGVSSTGTTIETTTSNVFAIKEGSTVTKASGTGTLNGTTKVVSILSDTSFTVDVQPSVNLSGATINISGYTIPGSFYVYKGASLLEKEKLAKYVVVSFQQVSTSSIFYLDNIWLGEGSTYAYEEARCVYVDLLPSKVNLLPDPSFSGSGWSSSGTYSDTESTDLTWLPYSTVTGNTMGKVITKSTSPYSTTSSNPDLTVQTAITVPNQETYYTFSVYIKGDSAFDLTLGLSCNSPAKVATPVPISVTTSWQRVSITIYVGKFVNGTTTTLTPYIYGTRNSSVTFRVDNAQLEQSQKPTDYFDGNFENQGAYWSGVSNESLSYSFINKDKKLSELSLHMSDWVPFGLLWVIRTPYLGIEALSIPTNTVIDSYEPKSGGSKLLSLMV